MVDGAGWKYFGSRPEGYPRGISPPPIRFEAGEVILISVPNSSPMLLRYLGKRGRHHLFVSVPGGWLTAYTDQQLIGERYRRTCSA